MRLGRVGTKKADRRDGGLIPVVGIDIGQQRDPTAIAVVEVEFRPLAEDTSGGTKQQSHYLARYLERLPLGTPYPEVARRLGEICRRVSKRCGHRPTVFVDATGVGKPVVDALRASRLEAHLWSVYFTHGDRRTERSYEHKVTLGKAYLVSRLQALLQRQRLHLPATSESRALARELLDYELRVDENANDKYGAFRVGTHDDLVTAIGLAVQKEPTIPTHPGSLRHGL